MFGFNRCVSKFNYDLIVADEVDSTNSELSRQLQRLRAIEVGKTGTQPPQTFQQKPLALVAFSQTAGRGRLGRTWASQPGGVYLSINLELSQDGQKDAALSLITALAVYEAVAQVLQSSTDNTNIQIKWPNDIVCFYGKLAGILLETNTSEEAIIGIGINVQRSAKAHQGAAFLSDLDNAKQPPKQRPKQFPELLEIAQGIIASVLVFHKQWRQAGFEFAPFAAEYNSKLNIIDQEITVKDINARILASGTALGVDSSGKLLVQDNRGIKSILSGDVTLR